MAAKYADKGFMVIAPSLDAEVKVTSFIKKQEITYPVVAGAGKTAQAFKVKAFPTMFLVGKDGKVLWKGHFKDDALVKEIDKALAGS